MSKLKLQKETSEVSPAEQNIESIVLETRKVKALEKIANSLDALTIWFEEIPKKEWGERVAYYLYEFYNIAKENNSNNSIAPNLPVQETTTEPSDIPARKPRPKKDIETI
jgi:hypothetical protein